MTFVNKRPKGVKKIGSTKNFDHFIDKKRKVISVIKKSSKFKIIKKGRIFKKKFLAKKK